MEILNAHEVNYQIQCYVLNMYDQMTGIDIDEFDIESDDFEIENPVGHFLVHHFIPYIQTRQYGFCFDYPKLMQVFNQYTPPEGYFMQFCANDALDSTVKKALPLIRNIVLDKKWHSIMSPSEFAATLNEFSAPNNCGQKENLNSLDMLIDVCWDSWFESDYYRSLQDAPRPPSR